jgi:hypothetical protein
MMRFLPRTLLFVLLLAGLVSADRHPLHLSSATLVQSAKNQWTLKKTIFTDDLEDAMESRGYEPIRLSDVANQEEKLNAYLHDMIRIYSGETRNSGREISWTLDAPYRYSAESIEVVLRFESRMPFRLYDGTLIQDFSDQKNVYSVRKSSSGWSQHAIIDRQTSYFVVK